MSKLIYTSSVSFSYNGHEVLKDITLDINERDFIAIIGPNGSGKTTLLKVLIGLLEAKGEIKIFGKDIKEFNNWNKIGYVPQRYSIDKNFPGTVSEILNGKTVAKVIDSNLLNKKFVNLSGGQQQRVLIALALQNNPEILFLDEPTAGVDIDAQQSFYKLLKELNKKIAVVIVTHEVGIVSSMVKTVFCINHKLCCVGKPNELPKFLKQLYGEHFIHHHRGHDD